MAEPLERLLGHWHGTGVGGYPTVAEFGYTESLVFSSDGRPFLHMAQVTRDSGGSTLHVEQAYLRSPADGRVEMVVAQPTGVVEVLEGESSEAGGATIIDVTSTMVGLTSTARAVGATRRRLELSGDLLYTQLWMSAAGHEDVLHLESRLRRGDDPS